MQKKQLKKLNFKKIKGDNILVGEVEGKTTTHLFKFRAYRNIKKMDFVVAKSKDNKWILAQITEINIYPDEKIIASCNILGRREDGLLKIPRMPIKPSSLIYQASEEQIRETLCLKKNGLYLGKLESTTDVKFYIDPDNAITKHIAILAQTGAGKSYTVGVLIEELLEKNIAVVIIDPHGEYSSLAIKNTNAKKTDLQYYEIEPKSYRVSEFSPDTNINKEASKLSFSDIGLEANEIIGIFPAKPTPTQTALLFGVISELKQVKENYTLTDIINYVQSTESTAKINLINLLELAKSSNLFSKKPTSLNALVNRGNASVINLKGINSQTAQISVSKLINTLFSARKSNKIPPLFLVIEEAHNFCPQNEVLCTSKIIRTIVSEGRKFGFGVAIISQRPARVDKNVLSQANTQIILRVKNPNDLKAISYAEGITKQAEEEIKNLASGVALILGCEIPLFVNIRTRKTKHGGQTQTLLESKKTQKDEKIYFKINEKYLKNKDKSIKYIFVPCYEIRIKDKLFLFDAIKGNLLFKNNNDEIKNIELKITSDEKKIISVLIEEDCSEDELFKKTKLLFDDFNRAIASMTKKNIIKQNKNKMCLNIQTIPDLQKQIFDKNLFEFNIEFLDIKIMAPKILSNIGIKKNAEITLVYYPYINICDVLIDATKE
ncbi:MAG: hypothetical protein B6U87_02155 [Candidatus Aenigmarchaeota archaeon ex4484_52]|nr:MAG: hypothetical protein B6U87_02155 [Candidatus Aenigmarchaeota archaeon ex4484_52]